MAAAEQVLVGAEVADVVAGPAADAAPRAALVVRRASIGNSSSSWYGCEQQLGLVGGAAHRDGELDLPVGGAGGDDASRSARAARARRRLIWVLAATWMPAAREVLDAPRARRRSCPRRRAARRASPRGRRSRRRRSGARPRPRPRAPLVGQVAAAGGHRRMHAARRGRADDVEPVLAQVGLAADERDLAARRARRAGDEVEASAVVELVGARAPGARAAVAAGEIAAERDLPDGVDGRTSASTLRTSGASGRLRRGAAPKTGSERTGRARRTIASRSASSIGEDAIARADHAAAGCGRAFVLRRTRSSVTRSGYLPSSTFKSFSLLLLGMLSLSPCWWWSATGRRRAPARRCAAGRRCR